MEMGAPGRAGRQQDREGERTLCRGSAQEGSKWANRKAICTFLFPIRMGNYKQEHGLQVHVILILPSGCRNDFLNGPIRLVHGSPQPSAPTQTSSHSPGHQPPRHSQPSPAKPKIAAHKKTTRPGEILLNRSLGSGCETALGGRCFNKLWQPALQLALPPHQQQLGRAAGTRGVPGHAGSALCLCLHRSSGGTPPSSLTSSLRAGGREGTRASSYHSPSSFCFNPPAIKLGKT